MLFDEMRNENIGDKNGLIVVRWDRGRVDPVTSGDTAKVWNPNVNEWQLQAEFGQPPARA